MPNILWRKFFQNLQLYLFSEVFQMLKIFLTIVKHSLPNLCSCFIRKFKISPPVHIFFLRSLGQTGNANKNLGNGYLCLYHCRIVSFPSLVLISQKIQNFPFFSLENISNILHSCTSLISSSHPAHPSSSFLQEKRRNGKDQIADLSKNRPVGQGTLNLVQSVT